MKETVNQTGKTKGVNRRDQAPTLIFAAEDYLSEESPYKEEKAALIACCVKSFEDSLPGNCAFYMIL